MTIDEFLLERIGEDEADAFSGWTFVRPGVEPGFRSNDGRTFVGAGGMPAPVRLHAWLRETWASDRAHAARPLAECVAKRRIVRIHELVWLEAWDCDVCRACANDQNCYWLDGGGPCQTLLALAAVYADHPDYDPAWKVTPV